MEEEENSKLCSASCTLSPALNLLPIMTIERSRYEVLGTADAGARIRTSNSHDGILTWGRPIGGRSRRCESS